MSLSFHIIVLCYFAAIVTDSVGPLLKEFSICSPLTNCTKDVFARNQQIMQPI